MQLHLLIFTFTFTLGFALKAQSMLEDGNRWVTCVSGPAQNMPGGQLVAERLYQIPIDNADSVIANVNYKKILNNEVFIGLLRESADSMIYFMPKDSVNEYLMYDFGAKSGDTVEVFANNRFVDLVVQNAAAGIISLENIGAYSITWYYHVGGTQGLFESDGEVILGGVVSLCCMSDTNQVRYSGQYSSGAPCRKTLVGLSNFEENNPIISIHPNPAENILYINIEGETFYQIEIVNALGQTILEQEIISTLTLDVSSWHRGIYFIKCHGAIQKFVLN